MPPSLNTDIIVYMFCICFTTSPFSDNSACHDLHLIKEGPKWRSCAHPFNKQQSWQYISPKSILEVINHSHTSTSLERFHIFAEVPLVPNYISLLVLSHYLELYPQKDTTVNGTHRTPCPRPEKTFNSKHMSELLCCNQGHNEVILLVAAA